MGIVSESTSGIPNKLEEEYKALRELDRLSALYMLRVGYPAVVA